MLKLKWVRRGVLKNSAFLVAKAFDWYGSAPNKKLRELARFRHKSPEKVFLRLGGKGREGKGGVRVLSPAGVILTYYILNVSQT